VVAIYNGYQTDGDPVVFWALDRDQNEINVHATTYRDNHSIPFPVIGEAYSVAQQFGVMYQPEYYIIRPDRSYVKKTNYSTMNTAVDEALASLGTGVSEAYRSAQVEILSNSIKWLGGEAQQAKVSITDVSGRTVQQEKIFGQQLIALDDLSAGVYVYTVEFNNTIVATGKIGLTD
jgi:hypothetical protein